MSHAFAAAAVPAGMFVPTDANGVAVLEKIMERYRSSIAEREAV